MASVSQDDLFYIINIQKKTCSCIYYLKNCICIHLVAYNNLKKIEWFPKYGRDRQFHYKIKRGPKGGKQSKVKSAFHKID